MNYEEVSTLINLCIAIAIMWFIYLCFTGFNFWPRFWWMFLIMMIWELMKYRKDL